MGSFVGAYLLYAESFLSPRRGPTLNTPIEHVVVLMKENHAFDNYFGTYSGVDGIPPNVSLPDGRGGSISPHRLTTSWTPDLPHSRAAMLQSYKFPIFVS